MGILRPGEGNDGSPQPEATPAPSNILNLLSLSPQDRESYRHLLVSREATQNGIKYYQDHAQNITSAPEVNIGELAIPVHVSDKSNLVNAIYTQINQQEAALQNLDPEKAKLIRVHLQAFAEGYAQGAIEAKDWETALKSYDTTTEGGIIQKPDIIKQLADAFAENTEVRNQMADLIENLIAKRGSSVPPSSSEIPHTSTLPTTSPISPSVDGTPPLVETDGQILRPVPRPPDTNNLGN